MTAAARRLRAALAAVLVQAEAASACWRSGCIAYKDGASLRLLSRTGVDHIDRASSRRPADPRVAATPPVYIAFGLL